MSLLRSRPTKNVPLHGNGIAGGAGVVDGSVGKVEGTGGSDGVGGMVASSEICLDFLIL